MTAELLDSAGVRETGDSACAGEAVVTGTASDRPELDTTEVGRRVSVTGVKIGAMASSLLDRAIYSYPDVDRLAGLHTGTARRWMEGLRTRGQVL